MEVVVTNNLLFDVGLLTIGFSSLQHRLTIHFQCAPDARLTFDLIAFLVPSLSLKVNEHLRDILVEEQKLREASLQESNATALKVRTHA